ncbi:MAG: hypothetical protein A2Z18_11245 [Armatimonadetes bacterium RBG_16_58_9]|nr:MAG: hypothetical protein A2Z18_11245 [Armatimonadetes bacterium RBG_16_58_9]
MRFPRARAYETTILYYYLAGSVNQSSQAAGRTSRLQIMKTRNDDTDNKGRIGYIGAVSIIRPQGIDNQAKVRYYEVAGRMRLACSTRRAKG